MLTCILGHRSGSGRMVVPHVGAVALPRATCWTGPALCGDLRVQEYTSVAGGLPCSPQAQPFTPTCGHGTSRCGSTALGLAGCQGGTAPR